MADPLCAPAVVRFRLNVLFTKVIDAVKCAFKYQEECNSLMERVTKLQSDIDGAFQSSTNCDDANSCRLEEMKSLLVGARRCAENGMNESRSESWKRMIKFWHWKKLTEDLMDFTQQIEHEQCDGWVLEHQINTIPIRAMYQMEEKPFSFVPRPVPSVIVGLDVLFNTLKESILANHTKNKASLLGLHGSSGAGKTLLAQMLHNDADIKKKYGVGSILWITVGLDSKVFDLYKRMGFFLGGTFEKNWSTQCFDEQRTYLCSAFAKQQVFLVLDDMWDKVQQSQKMMHWLNIATAPGSTTLITTQSSSVLSQVHAESIGILKLSDDDSWELFCTYAFHDGILPSTISKKLAKEVCKECKGLPLALKVIGSAMVDKAMEGEWKIALLHLKQSQPIMGSSMSDELYGRLQLCYNMLENDVLRTCFLYLAAFPEDYEIQLSNLFDMWIAEGLFGSLDIGDAESKAQGHLEILHTRSLLDWNRKRGYVQVHNVLRNLALNIIARSKLGDCAYMCCFHSKKVLQSFPPKNSSLQAIKRMSLMNSSIHEWQDELQASNLQVCILSKIDIPTSQNLCFISNMTSLKYLNLSHTQFNYGKNQINFEGMKLLMYLDLSYCEYLKELPESICKLESLTHLYLEGCSSLRELPRSIGELKCLMYLNLKWCKSLEELPRSIGKLECLTQLNLRWCQSLEKLQESIDKLESLATLNLEGCESLEKLPSSIGKLKCLTHLNLGGCSLLKELPGSIGELKCLTYLNLKYCKYLEELPESICKLEYLTQLSLEGCSSLKKLPWSIGELKCLSDLNLKGCISFNELPGSIGKLKYLTYLNLEGCKSLEELPKTIGQLESLTCLFLGGCESLKGLPSIISEMKCLATYGFSKPRMLITLDEDLKPLPVSVRVGQAVDVVGQAGRPKSITGFQTHTTPVILATGDRAELATEKYIPLSMVLEGFVILKLNPDYQQDHLSS